MGLDITVRCERCGRELESELVYVRDPTWTRLRGHLLDVKPCEHCEKEAIDEALTSVGCEEDR